jgi:hypothetical protein
VLVRVMVGDALVATGSRLVQVTSR